MLHIVEVRVQPGGPPGLSLPPRTGAMSVRQAMTIEDLEALPERPGVRLELADGELVESPGAGLLHSLIAAMVYELLRGFVRERDLGVVFTDGTGYVLRR